MDTGSYMLLEPGMQVRSRDGRELGTIVEVVADENADIFRGMVVSPSGLMTDRVFVSGEHLTAVQGDIATVDLDHDGLVAAGSAVSVP